MDDYRSKIAGARVGWPSALRATLATFFGAAVLFVIHVYYGRGIAANYVDHAFKTRPWKIFHEPYPTYVFWTALFTEMLPVLGMVIVYLMLRDRLPGRSTITKGLWYGALLMFCTDSFVRLPLMNALVGNPLDVVLVQALQDWMIYPLVGLTIALLTQSVGRIAWTPQSSN